MARAKLEARRARATLDGEAEGKGAEERRGEGDDADDPMGGRMIPGAGDNFASAWQRQFELEEERTRVRGEGQRIENDTLFAFAFDQQREREDRQKLAELQRANAELAATPITAALRKNEPVSLGRVASQGLETRHLEPIRGSGAGWRPWARGTAAHAAMLKLVAGTPEPADDEPPSAKRARGMSQRVAPERQAT